MEFYSELPVIFRVNGIYRDGGENSLQKVGLENSYRK